MSVPSLNHTLETLGRSYLVVDVNCLFVAASLREEIWLYCQQENAELLGQVQQAAGHFRIGPVDPDRDLVTYSGGEQAILACLLMLALIQANTVTNLRLLLCGVLESISRENRQRLGRLLQDASATHGLGVFQRRDNQVEELALVPCAS